MDSTQVVDKKTVLVTGGSRGIGRAIAISAISQGHRVLITYNTGKSEAEETMASARKDHPDAEIFSYQLDVKDSSAVDQLIDQLIKEHENIHALINNAAVLKDNVAVWMSDEEWHEVINTNLNGPFYLARSLLPHFISNRFGRIVNLASLSAHGSAGQANYAASKAGLLGLTYTLAREYGRKNITTNGIIPGVVQTDMRLPDQVEADWIKYSVLGRVHKASEIADVTMFLISDAAASVNGEIIKVTGGGMMYAV